MFWLAFIVIEKTDTVRIKEELHDLLTIMFKGEIFPEFFRTGNHII